MLTQLAIGYVVSIVAHCPVSQEYSIENILDNIEQADVSSLTASISYTKTDPILERREIRTGKVLFRTNEGKKREAAIIFDTLIIGRRREEKQKHYIFSGRWMLEVDYANKQFIKRELVAPGGKVIDPFELGSGPIPLPIGQTKDSILSKFDVEIMELPKQGALSKLAGNIVGLSLKPKTKDEWELIELFYDPETWLPIAVRTEEIDGTKRVCILTNMQANKLSEEDAQLLNIDTPDPREWSIDIRPWSE